MSEDSDNIPIDYTYKVSNHLLDHLDIITGNKKNNIDECTINKIKDEIILLDVDLKDVTTRQIKEILRKMHKLKYYNNIVYIWKEITNKDCIKISDEEKENILDIFMRFHKEYKKLYPRNSFFSYNFILQKICFMLGYDNIAKEFPQLRSKDKTLVNEERWNNLCKSVEPNYSKLF